MKNIKNCALSLSVLILSAMLIIYSKSAAEGASGGIKICIATIIPTMFPFMTAAQLLSISGIADKIGSIIARPFEKLFCLPSCCACTVLLGLVGGYPVGAKMSAELYRQGKISRTQLRRLLCFAVNAGPSFIISTVGVAVLGNKKAGIMLLISCIAACLTMGIISKYIFREQIQPKAELSSPAFDFSQSLTIAVRDSSRAVLSMCCYIILFSTLLSLCDGCGAIGAISHFISALFGADSKTVTAALYCIMEVGSGCMKASGNVMLICWALGWGSISVHFQIFSFLSDIKISRLGFALSRLICASLSCLYFYVLMSLFPIDLQVFSSFKPTFAMSSGQLFVSFMFVIIMLAALFSAESKAKAADNGQ